MPASVSVPESVTASASTMSASPASSCLHTDHLLDIVHQKVEAKRSVITIYFSDLWIHLTSTAVRTYV